MKTILKIAALSLAVTSAHGAMASTNVVPAHWNTIFYSSNSGVLRPGSPWGPGSTPSNPTAPVDGVFEPTSQQWNNGSYWWDEDPSTGAAGSYWQVNLDAAYTFNQLIVQADDNDSYLVQYWNGSGWQNVFNVAAVGGYGLQTRNSGMLAQFTTSKFRFTATGGDNYYALSEFQAFSVPEPSTWALLILGMGAVGAAMRRRRQVRVAFG